MSKQDKVMNTYYCNTCKTVMVVSNEMQSCGFCSNEIEDIGWVEEYNG